MGEKYTMLRKPLYSRRISVLFILTLFLSVSLQAQTSIFTYQGRLSDNSLDAQGTYQMQFSLYDMAAGGTQIGSTIENTMVEAVNGVFTVQLDFGSTAFDGTDRFLEIAVCKTTCPTYTTLNTRQQITSAPYAVKALNAGNADTATTAANADQLDGVAADQYIQEGDSRLTDDRNPTPGSPNYVQNTTTVQTSSNFNIDGTGRADIFNAKTQFNLNGNRFLSSDNVSNTFAGVGAGASNTPGTPVTSSGKDNSFFGQYAGQDNTSGGTNSFFGQNAGPNNKTGDDNSFFGKGSGLLNELGDRNSFFGMGAGLNNLTGNNNSFFGVYAGLDNKFGSNISIFGRSANVGSDDLSFATAIGALAIVTSNNTIQLGRNGSDVVRIGKLGAVSGTFLCFNSSKELASCSSSPLTNANSFIANQAGEQSSSKFHIDGTGTAGIFDADTQFRLGGNNILNFAATNILQLGRDGTDVIRIGTLGAASGTFLCFNSNKELAACTSNPTTGSFIANQTTEQTSSNFNISGTGTADIFNAKTKVGIGTPSPENRLHVVHPAISGNVWGIRIENESQSSNISGMRVSDNGFFEISNNIGAVTPNFARLDSGGNWTAVSDVRLKQNIFPASGLLDKVLALRPVSYTFINQPNLKQIGLLAQEVESVLPEFVTNGGAEESLRTMNYSQLSVVAIGAIQEQQTQLEKLQDDNKELQTQVKQQQTVIDGLLKLICADKPDADVCTEVKNR